MSTINDRIRIRRIELGYSQQELADMLGLKHKTSISKIELGKRQIRQRELLAIAKALKTSTKWLIDGQHSVYTEDNILPFPKMKLIPLLGNIACGTPILASENIQEMVQVPSHISADFALICKGDSMINAGIQDGDMVYIRKQITVENGQIAAVRIGEEATLKRVMKTKQGILLIPENNRYQPIMLTEDTTEDIAIEGIAVGFTRYWG